MDCTSGAMNPSNRTLSDRNNLPLLKPTRQKPPHNARSQQTKNKRQPRESVICAVEAVVEVPCVDTSHKARENHAINEAPRGLQELAQSLNWVDAPVNMQCQESRNRIHDELGDMLNGF